MPLKQQRPLRVLLTKYRPLPLFLCLVIRSLRTDAPPAARPSDDGPPSASESPMIGSFARALKEFNGWDVRVVVPSSQKSWIGGAYQIAGLSSSLL